MAVTYTTYSEEETIALGARLGTVLGGGSVVLLDGDLGAGKTHFAKGVARGLGIRQEVTSPTFNLVLEYKLAVDDSANVEQQTQVLRHFDLYRFETSEQLDDIDYFGLIEDETAVSLVEWGSRFADALPLDYMSIEIAIEDAACDKEQRRLEFHAHGQHATKMLELFEEQVQA